MFKIKSEAIALVKRKLDFAKSKLLQILEDQFCLTLYKIFEPLHCRLGPNFIPLFFLIHTPCF